MLTIMKLYIPRRNFQFLFKHSQRQNRTTRNSDSIIKKQKTEFHQNTSNNNAYIQLNQYNNTRAFSTIQTKVRSPIVASEDETREFKAIFPQLVRDLTDATQQSDIPEVNQRFAKLLYYTVPNGKMFRGLCLLTSYKLLEKTENLTPENIRRAIILGWCTEMLISSMLIGDDLMDNSEIRRGIPCWHRLDNNGIKVLNDAVFIMNGLYGILKKYLSDHHCYVPTMELFHDITMKTTQGEALDVLSLKDGRPNFEKFTMNRYNAIVKYKTCYCLITLPIVLSMYLANLYDPEMHRQAETISMEIGNLYQIQDDFLDCFGDPKKTGKYSNDISEGKCTWFSVVALQRVNRKQRKIMVEYYGKDDPEAIQIIRNLYKELDLPNIYAAYEEENVKIIRTHIQQISKKLPQQIFFNMTEAMYKREC